MFDVVAQIVHDRLETRCRRDCKWGCQRSSSPNSSASIRGRRV